MSAEMRVTDFLLYIALDLVREANILGGILNCHAYLNILFCLKIYQYLPIKLLTMVRKAIHYLAHAYLYNLPCSQCSNHAYSLSVPHIAHTFTYLRTFEYAIPPISVLFSFLFLSF